MSKGPVQEPQQTRAAQTRDAILDAVAELAKDPDATITTSAIAAQANVAVGTIYRYFEDGGKAVLAAYDRALNSLNGRWFAGLPDLVGLSPKAQAQAFLDTYLACARHEPAYVDLLRHARRHRSAEAEFILNTETPESHAAFAEIFSLKMDPAQRTTIKLLKFISQRMMDLYFIADEEERDAIGNELVCYTTDVLTRLRDLS